MTIAELERLLDVYGSDRTRWPVEARAGAGQLVARDRAARRLLGEAEALDRVLERAPLPSLAQEAALADRIIGAAQRSPRIVPRRRPRRLSRPPAAPTITAPTTSCGSGRCASVAVAAAGRRSAGVAAGVFAASLAGAASNRTVERDAAVLRRSSS